MRVRYGKPIKVKNLSDVKESFSITSASSLLSGCGGQWISNTHKSYLYQQLSTRVSHKVFLLFKVSASNLPSTSDVMRLISVRANGNSVMGGAYTVYKTDAMYYGSFDVTAGTSTDTEIADTWLQLNSGKTFEVGTSYTWFIIDLTEAFGSGKEPTAQEFYNKYNKYFSLIATGEEITIDDKAGQIKTVKSILDDYIELEYIESTGTQYINPSIVLNNNMNFDFDIYWTSKTTFLFGVNSGGQETLLMPRNVYLNGGSKSFTEDIIALNTKYHFEFNMISSNGYIKRNGEAIFTRGTGTCKPNSELYLFANVYVNGDKPQTYQQYRLYNFKLRENNIIRYNLVPAIRKSDNEIGMLDKVNNVFYTNQGSGTFIAGPTKELPSEYQQVEYIQSDGNQYLSLDVGSFNANFKLDIDFQQTSNSTAELCLFGNSGLEVFTRTEGFGYWTSASGSSFATNYASLREQRVFASIDNSNGKMWVNSVETTYTPKTVSSYTSINVFRYAYSDRYLFVGRIFYLKLYTGNKYIELIPCYRKLDNVIGMYDLVNRVFYTNQGTGTFLKGNNINNILSCKVAGGSSDIYYGYNNLIDIYSYNAEMTVSNVIGTKITLTTTSTGINRFSYNIPFISGHKYLLHEKITTGSTIPYTKIVCTTKNDSLQAEPTLWENVTPNTTKNIDLILTAVATQTDLMRVIYLSSGLTAGISFDVEDIYLLDLTDWFGIGKEPSTVQEFKEKFTKEYYGFCSTPIKLTRYQIEALPSYGYNQLIQFIQRNNYNGITWTPTTNGIYSLSGTSTNTYSSWGEQLVNEHKYMIYLNIIYNPNNVQMKVGLLNVSSGSTEYITSGNVYKIVKYNTGDGKSFGIVYPSSGISLNNMQIQVMCIDLTDWYGAGSEPTTVEEFKATFPNKYYPYSKKRLLNKYMINKLIN